MPEEASVNQEANQPPVNAGEGLLSATGTVQTADSSSHENAATLSVKANLTSYVTVYKQGGINTVYDKLTRDAPQSL